jgi:copper chaperone
MTSRESYLLADPLAGFSPIGAENPAVPGLARASGVISQTMLRYRCMKHSDTELPDVRTTTLSIAGMSCGACVRHVTRALDGMTGVVHAQVDLRTNEAIVEHIPAYVQAAALIAAVGDAGYEAGIVRTVDDRDVMARRPEVSSACGCGCCGGKPKTTVSAGWPGLGTDTIG